MKFLMCVQSWVFFLSLLLFFFFFLLKLMSFVCKSFLLKLYRWILEHLWRHETLMSVFCLQRYHKIFLFKSIQCINTIGCIDLDEVVETIDRLKVKKLQKIFTMFWNEFLNRLARVTLYQSLIKQCVRQNLLLTY